MKKSEKTEITISKIIKIATEQFGMNGYSGGTINNICKAGINKGLLYHNFAGKDELYLTCLNRSCEKFMQYIHQQDRVKNLENYMSARMEFFNQYTNEAHIFFEALLNPPIHLLDEINKALTEFNKLNEKMYSQTLDNIILRDGISKTDAISYFHMMQLMINGYFSSPAFKNTDLKKKVEIHEVIVPRLLDCMLYGIAKREN